MATPPASVAFKTSSILNLPPLNKADKKNTIVQDPIRANTVLIYAYSAIDPAKNPLKLITLIKYYI